MHQILGAICLLFGLYATLQRLRGKELAFKKLEAMRALWGKTAGDIVHTAAYCLLPIIAGLVLMAK